MDGMLSQEEINALLGGADTGSGAEDVSSANSEVMLTPEESDALGEIANISMGTAATTLSVLVNNRVDITTPTVTYTTMEELAERQETPCVFIYISYRVGLEGKNMLILNERDVKIITDLMMGGDGTNLDAELGELHLSAICEAMNQMMGSASTSMSSMINEMVDISPPTATRVDFGEEFPDEFKNLIDQTFVQVSFKMEVGDLVDSQIMQLYPMEFARRVYEQFRGSAMGADAAPEESSAPPAPEPAPAPAPQPQMTAPQPEMQPQMAAPQMNMGAQQQPMAGMQPMYAMPPQDINIQPAQFQSFMPVQNLNGIAPENIDLIMDVPLEVTVELGRTSKSIKEILDFSPGTIIELDKLAGEPVDVLVNGKFVAKGEVVVIEESFGNRVTEIIKD